MRSWILLTWQKHHVLPQLLLPAVSVAPLRHRSTRTRHVSTVGASGQDSTSTSGEHALIRTDQSGSPTLLLETREPPQLPLASTRNNPDSWIEVLEPCLPSHLRASQLDRPILSPTIAARIIEEAERKHSVDVLAHLGLARARWDATIWLANAIVNSSKAPSASWKIPDTLSSIQWPQESTLDQFTKYYLSKDEIQDPQSARYRPQQAESLALRRSYLDRALSPLLKHTHDEVAVNARRALGQVWLFLGRILLAAADMDEAQSSVIVGKAIDVLSNLFKRGHLPNDMTCTWDTYDVAVKRLPRTMAILSMIVSDQSIEDRKVSRPPVAGLVSEVLDGSSKASNHSRPFSQVRSQAPNLWLEYVLWCCVHGGWVVEGASILGAMKKAPGRQKWSLVSTRDIQTAPISKADTRDQQELDSHGPAVLRTMNAEVVVALVDGLVIGMQGGRTDLGYSAREMLDRLGSLNRLLGEQRMSLGTSTWDALIARFVDSPNLPVDRYPRLHENVLALAKPYGNEASSRNAMTKVGRGEEESFFSYVFDGSAAVLGLYHRTLHSHIRARDVDGSLRVLAALQRLTDENKEKSLSEFFRELKSTALDESGQAAQKTAVSRARRFPGVDFPGFFPSMPVNVLADLLDLLNDCNAYDLGSWMIYSSDIDGPLIPEVVYGNQAIAPALIRFAAATSDTNLLRKLTRAQSSSISGLTLVALCESRIRQGLFDGAADVFGLIRDYALHEWTAVDFSMVLRAILLQIYGVGASFELGGARSRQASVLCQRLLRGDLGQVWGANSFAKIDTIVELISSFDGHLADLCSNLMPRGQNFTAELDSASFDYLLDAAVKIWGSRKGKDIWLTWCREDADGRLLGRPGGARVAKKSIAALFSAAPQEPSNVQGSLTEDDLPASGGRITPALSSLRVIVLQALQELREQGPLQRPQSDQETLVVAIAEETRQHGAHDILDWAAEVLRSEFDLSETDIDYELQGYLSAKQPSPINQADDYSPETTQIWGAFAGSRKTWAQRAEHSLRELAESKTDTRLVFEQELAAERALLTSLARDLGLASETHGEGAFASVTVFKRAKGATPHPTAQVSEQIYNSNPECS